MATEGAELLAMHSPTSAAPFSRCVAAAFSPASIATRVALGDAKDKGPNLRPLSIFPLAGRLGASRRRGRASCLLGALLLSAVALPARAEADFSLERTEQWSMTSAKGDVYLVSIGRPQTEAPATGYRVIYALDPQWSFATLVETARLQEELLGPTVIVGLGYPQLSNDRRVFDMTIPADRATLPNNRFDPPYGAIGGADAFLTFIETIVKPAVAKRIPIDGSRQTLAGHSLGGLVVLHALFTRPDTFQTYVAGSPSIWWGDRAINLELQAFAKRDLPAPRRLLITVGGLEQSSSLAQDALAASSVAAEDRAAVVKMSRCITREMAQVDHARWLAQRLRDVGPPQLEIRYVEFGDEDHLSVVPSFLARTVRFASSEVAERAKPRNLRSSKSAPPSTDLLACTRPFQSSASQK